jgi:hypothetical protein
VLYPTSGRHPLAVDQHGLLAKAFDTATPFQGQFALREPIDRRIVVGALRHEIELSGLQTVVVSSEEFYRFDASTVEDFASSFADFDIQPVAFVRNFPQLFDSLYGTILQYTDYSFPPNEMLLDTDLIGSFGAWASISANGQIHVVDFDASTTGDSVRDMLSVIGLEPELLRHLSDRARLNASRSPMFVVLLRELRNLGVEQVSIDGLLEQLARLEVSEAQTSLPADLREKLAERYREQIAALRRAPFVRGLGLEKPASPSGEQVPIYLASLADVVFAIGRAIHRSSH